MSESTPKIQRTKATRRTLVTARPIRASNGSYHFRRKVPEKLRELVGFTEYKRALGTSDESEAKIRFAAEYALSERLFASARKELSGQSSVGLRDVQQLAADWFRAEQARLEAGGGFEQYLETDGGGAWECGDRYETYTDYVSLRRAMAEGQEVPLQEWALRVATGVFRAQGVLPPREGSEAGRWAVEAFSEHLLKLSELAYERHNGDWQKSFPVLPALPVPHMEGGAEPAPRLGAGTKKVLLRDLFAEYADQKRLDAGLTRAVTKTLKTYEAALDTFIELMGDVPITEISRPMVVAYRGQLAQLPRAGIGLSKLSGPERIRRAQEEGLQLISAGTIRNHIAALSAVLAHGERMNYISENPVTGSGIRKAATKAATKSTYYQQKRSDYSREELKQIFESPIFTPQGWEPPRAKLGRAMYWLPLMLYYTGARREELAQLKVSDVKESDGIPFLDILTLQETGEARTVKTDSSRRQIPLHPDLITRGFLEYIEGLPKDGMLFPALKPGPDGYYGVGFGKHWRNYLRDIVGLRSSVSPAHGFRHTFKTMCRDAGIAEDVHDAITGHAGSAGVSRGYGSMPLSRMHQAVCSIPSVDVLLSRQVPS